MKTVGIRELRQRASEFLRLVEAGETFEVTDRGRPIALLTPVPDASPIEQLRAVGELSERDGTIEELPEPLPLPAGHEAPSAILARLRDDER
jgi:prevent-host-death family protein